MPWLSAAGARKSLELLVSLGNDRIAEHNLALARSLTEKLGLPEPESPIVRFRVADAEGPPPTCRRRASPAPSGRGRSASFHLYNDEDDVELAASAVGAVE